MFQQSRLGRFLRTTITGESSYSRVLRLALLASTATALLDLEWNLVVFRPHQFNADLVVWPVLLLFVTTFALIGLAWWLGKGLVDRQRPGAATSIAVFFVIFTPTWTVFFDLSESLLLPQNLSDWVKLVLLTGLAAAISLVLRRILGLNRDSPSTRAQLTLLEDLLLVLNAFLLALLPVLMAELLWIEGLLSASSLLAMALLLSGCLALARIFVKSRLAFKRIAFGLVWIFLGGLVTLSVGVVGYPRLASPSAGRGAALPPVVLITIDTLRADSLNSYGGQKSLTPNLDSLAQKSVLFERTFASSPWTMPSMVSMMTGCSTLVHQTPDRSPDLPAVLPTLAEPLQEVGYITLGVGRNAHLRASTGFSRGFDLYRFYPRAYLANSLGTQLLRAILPAAVDNEATTRELARRASKLVARFSDQPFFLWLHFFDPHIPYEPPSEFLPRTFEGRRFGTRFDKVREVRSGRLFPDGDQRTWIRNLYEGEIRYVDHEIGQFLSTLDRLDLFDPALVIVSSDHGEEFWEHGGFEHGHALNNEVIGVPLIVKPPKSSGTPSFEGLRVESPVSIASVRSTILDVVGASPEDQTVPTARSLAPFWDGPPLEGPTDAIVSGALRYFGQQLSVVRGPYKYIRHLEGGHEELYELVSDPAESYNLASIETELTRELAEILDQEIERSRQIAEELGIGQNTSKGHMDKETEQELRSLGYIE